MPSTTLSSKGQIVIPKEIREKHDWQFGQLIDMEDRGDYVVMRLMRGFQRTTVADLAQCLTRNGPVFPLSGAELGNDTEEVNRKC